MAGAVAGVGAQGAADRAGNADQRFQPGQAVTGGFRNQGRHRGPGAGPDALALHDDLSKYRFAQPKHHAFHAFIADDQIAAAAQNTERNTLLVAALHEGGQFLVRTRLREHLGRAAQFQIGIRRQRLVALKDFFKLGETGHSILQTGAGRLLS